MQTKMTKVTILFLFILLAVCQFSVYSQKPAEKIAGVYQFCPFHCEAYRLNTDFTFDYLIDGDLYNDERSSGTWEFVGTERIRLKLEPVSKKLIQSVEEKSGDRDSITVDIFDQAGAAYSGAVINLINNDKTFQYITDENGRITIPKVDLNKVDTINVKYNNHEGIYRIKNSSTVHLIINLDTTIFFTPIIDDQFVIKSNMICKVLDEEDKNDIAENCHVRLNQKRADRIFPPKQ